MIDPTAPPQFNSMFPRPEDIAEGARTVHCTITEQNKNRQHEQQLQLLQQLLG